MNNKTLLLSSTSDLILQHESILEKIISFGYNPQSSVNSDQPLYFSKGNIVVFPLSSDAPSKPSVLKSIRENVKSTTDAHPETWSNNEWFLFPVLEAKPYNIISKKSSQKTQRQNWVLLAYSKTDNMLYLLDPQNISSGYASDLDSLLNSVQSSLRSLHKGTKPAVIKKHFLQKLGSDSNSIVESSQVMLYCLNLFAGDVTSISKMIEMVKQKNLDYICRNLDSQRINIDNMIVPTDSEKTIKRSIDFNSNQENINALQLSDTNNNQNMNENRTSEAFVETNVLKSNFDDLIHLVNDTSPNWLLRQRESTKGDPVTNNKQPPEAFNTPVSSVSNIQNIKIVQDVKASIVDNEKDTSSIVLEVVEKMKDNIDGRHTRSDKKNSKEKVMDSVVVSDHTKEADLPQDDASQISEEASAPQPLFVFTPVNPAVPASGQNSRFKFDFYFALMFAGAALAMVALVCMTGVPPLLSATASYALLGSGATMFAVGLMGKCGLFGKTPPPPPPIVLNAPNEEMAVQR